MVNFDFCRVSFEACMVNFDFCRVSFEACMVNLRNDMVIEKEIVIVKKDFEGVYWSELMEVVLPDVKMALRVCHWNFVVIPID